MQDAITYSNDCGYRDLGSEFAEDERNSRLGLAAADEFERFANGMLEYCKSNRCEPEVSLLSGHPVAVAMNEWYTSVGCESDIDTACVRSIGDDEDLELWRDFTSCTMYPALWGKARSIARKVARRLREMYRRPETSEAMEVPGSTPVKSTRHVQLFGMGEPVRVNGVEKPRLTRCQYCVVEALVEANPTPLTEKELIKKSGYPSARNALSKLRKDRDWNDVIDPSGESGRGYYIK